MYCGVRPLMVGVLACALNACAFVQLTPAGKKVRVLSEGEVAACQRLGETSASVIAKAGPFQRIPERVQQELDDVASNSAAEMGGDTVVRIGQMQDGRQSYRVYRCMPASS